MDKYFDLKNELVNYVESIKLSIADMQEEIKDLEAQNAAASELTFENNFQNMERSLEIAKTRVSIAEMLSVVDELNNLLANYKD